MGSAGLLRERSDYQEFDFNITVTIELARTTRRRGGISLENHRLEPIYSDSGSAAGVESRRVLVFVHQEILAMPKGFRL